KLFVNGPATAAPEYAPQPAPAPEPFVPAVGAVTATMAAVIANDDGDNKIDPSNGHRQQLRRLTIRSNSAIRVAWVRRGWLSMFLSTRIRPSSVGRLTARRSLLIRPLIQTKTRASVSPFRGRILTAAI